jgi:hypothetical protein
METKRNFQITSTQKVSAEYLVMSTTVLTTQKTDTLSHCVLMFSFSEPQKMLNKKHTRKYKKYLHDANMSVESGYFFSK